MSKSKQKTSVRAGAKAANKTHAPASDKGRKAAADEIAQRIERLEAAQTPAAPEQPTAVNDDGGPAGKASAAADTPARKRRVGPGGKRIAAPKPAKAPKPPKVKKVSGLDAAAMVLAESASPMKAVDMLAEIQKRGLWTSKGKTPEATLYAAIIREIAAKGSTSRFRKHDRGLFTAAAGKGA